MNSSILVVAFAFLTLLLRHQEKEGRQTSVRFLDLRIWSWRWSRYHPRRRGLRHKLAAILDWGRRCRRAANLPRHDRGRSVAALPAQAVLRTWLPLAQYKQLRTHAIQLAPPSLPLPAPPPYPGNCEHNSILYAPPPGPVLALPPYPGLPTNVDPRSQEPPPRHPRLYPDIERMERTNLQLY